MGIERIAREEEEAAKKAKKAEAERKAKEIPKPPTEWVTVEEEKTRQQNKLELDLGMNTGQLRKTVSQLSCVPLRYLVIEIAGEELVEARELPFWDNKKHVLRFNHETQVVKWYRGDRLKRLLKKRELATINNVDKFERSATHFSTIDGDFELLEEIVCDADFKFSLINKQDIFGDTALHYACILGHADIIELLLDKQANPELQNIKRRTPTMLASEHGHGMAMRALLRSGASIKPGSRVWRFPSAPWLATLNGRNKVLKEIDNKRTEDKAMAEMEEHLARLDAELEDD